MLTVFTGPMFSGKTSGLISRAMSHVIAGDFVIAFKPTIDNRYDNTKITTHDKKSFPSYPVHPDNAFIECNEILMRLLGYGQKVDVIAFDEAQFFRSEDMISLVEEYMTWSHVIVAGLKEDSKGATFGAMPQLLCMADDIICLKAVCAKCKKINAASRTYAKKEISGQILVGGIDVYEPRCLRCWL